MCELTILTSKRQACPEFWQGYHALRNSECQNGFDHDSDVIIELAQENTATHQSVTVNAGYVCSVIAFGKFIFQSLVVMSESLAYPIVFES